MVKCDIADRYYRNQSDVLYGPKKEDEEGHPLRNADNRIPRNFHGLIVNQKAAYAFTTPPTFDVGNSKANAEILNALGDEYRKECMELCVNAANAGVAWIHYWTNELNEFEWAVIDSKQIVPIWNKSAKQKLIGALRVYTQIDEADGKNYTIYEYWNKEECQVYRRLQSDLNYDNLTDYAIFENPTTGELVSEYSHGMEEIPFIPFFNNNIKSSDLDNIKPLIDVYDKVFSGFINDLEDVQDKDGDKHGDNGENPVGPLLGFCVIGFRFFESAGAVSGEVALAGCGKTLLIPLDVEHTDNDEDDGDEQAEETAGADVGAEVAGAEDVIGDGNPRNSQTEVQAEGVTSDNGSAVDISLAAELECDGVADEEADEAGDTGHCEDGGEDADAERNILRADEVEDNTRKAVGAARDVQQLAEQSAEEEQDHPGLHEADEAAHIGVEQAGGDVHLVDDHENDGADNAANQGGNVFVAEQTDKQDCSYEDEDVHKYSPKKYI